MSADALGMPARSLERMSAFPISATCRDQDRQTTVAFVRPAASTAAHVAVRH